MFRKLCQAYLVCVLAVCVLAAAPCRADDDANFNRDLRHTIAARTALFADRELGPLNLGVKVHNRVATLWGPVRTPEIARRAVEVLRQLPDLIDVRDELKVESDPKRPLFLPEIAPERLRLPLLPLPQPGPPGILANRSVATPVIAALPADSNNWRPVQVGQKDPRIPDDRQFDRVVSALPVPAPPPETDKPLPQALADLHKDKRFNHLRIEMAGNVVYLRSEPEQRHGIYELAGIISRLAGVERVVVKDN
jgi:hypothetical protein